MNNTKLGIHHDSNHRDISLQTLSRSRIRRIVRGLDHLPLATNPKAFLHILPVGEENYTLNTRSQQTVETARTLPLLFRRHPHYYRINFDGFFGYQKSDEENFTITSYHQWFWNGSLEYCDASWLRSERRGISSIEPIPLPLLEFEIVQTITHSLAAMKQVQVPSPLQVQVAFVGLRGCRTMAHRHFYPENCFFDRDELFFQPIVINDWEDNPASILRPVFDQIWNAGGYIRSLSYDEDGNWKPDLR